jgi:hypothetical protein
MAPGRQLLNPDPGAGLEHRLQVRRDLPHGGDLVPPRAGEQEPAPVQRAEVRPLQPGPRLLEPLQRPSPRHMGPLQRLHLPQAAGDVPAGVEHAPAELRDFPADAVVEDERAQAAAEEPEIGDARDFELRDPVLDVLAHLEDKLRQDRRVGSLEDGIVGLVRDHVITRPDQPPDREAHPLDRGAVRADVENGGGIRGSKTEFLALEQPVMHEHSAPGEAHPGH